MRRGLAARTAQLDKDGVGSTRSRAVVLRAARVADSVRASLKDWFDCYAAYAPELTWWLLQPWLDLDSQLEASGKSLRLAAGASDPQTIVVDPLGRDALVQGLSDEMIPYSPEELMQQIGR